MKTASSQLLSELNQYIEKHLEELAHFALLPEPTLNWKPDLATWSVLECLEHLVRYGNFYLPEVTQRIQSAKHTPRPTFTSGWVGNYFAQSMLPGPQMKKMNTFKSKNPAGSALNLDVLKAFEQQLEEWQRLLNQAANVDLQTVRTSTTLGKYPKLRLGDTLRIVIYHNERHMWQIERILSGTPKEKERK